MVSFSCENCGDVLTKKKLDQHRGRCHGATFTCIDCMVHFPGFEYRAHTTCMTEDQKYQGALYKNKKQRGNNINNNINNNYTYSRHNPRDPLEPLNGNMIPAHAYVEDVPEDGRNMLAHDANSPPEALFEAPTPPPAVPEPPTINVFDFLVDGDTPDVSHVNFTTKDSGQLVRYDYENDAYVDDDGYMVDDDNDALVRYGTGPIPSAEAFQTPVEKPKKPDKAAEPKTDKKRKRPHPEIKDQVMTDAPALHHSGLTAEINRMMQYPPSPEFSGDGNDSGDVPASPTKKTKHKHSRHKSTSSTTKVTKSRHRSESIGNGLLALVGAASKPKKPKVAKKKSSHSGSARRRRDSEESEKSSAAKLLEYSPGSRLNPRGSDHHHHHHNQVVLYRPRADLFLSLVNKGPESERGCSVNKALKRFHRERSSSREAREGRANKSVDEKELWRSLRMRRNDRGEIVLFSLDDEE